ncbi:MAG: cation:proton antiporter [Myxococcales bacterium]|nr:cation:proton antiporter [Myxococcales bacterium]
MEHPLFVDIVAILSVSALTLFVANRLGLPSIVAYLAAGVVAGPRGLAMVRADGEVLTLAEIGTILLLFTIGIEFSLSTLLRLRRQVLLGGNLQMFGTIAVVVAVVVQFGSSFRSALFLGVLLALSSTAIVLKILQKRAEIDAPQGRMALSILIFQDLAVVPILLGLPLLAGDATFDLARLGPYALKAGGAVVGILVAAKWVLPRLLHDLAASRDPEIFQIGVVVLGFGIAYVTQALGLSLAMGAFLAGLILSESPFAQRALGNLLPLRDLFMSFFFVSIGMLFDFARLWTEPALVLGGTAAVVVVKALLATGAGRAVGLPLGPAVMGGIALAQVGEFSFVVAGAGMERGLLAPEDFQRFLAVSVVSMIATPFLIQASPHIARWALRLPLPRAIRVGTLGEDRAESLRDHLVVIGYGLGGRHVVEAAEAARIPYAVLEANPDTVRAERAAGRPVYHGDASQEPALEHVHVASARVAVVAISDGAATRRVVERLRALNPNLYILARTRYFAEAESLRALGASEVIPEEYETSVEIFTRVLHRYLVPKEEVEAFVARVRAGGYAMLRGPSAGRHAPHLDLLLSNHEIRVIAVEAGSGAEGKSLAELNLRKASGVTILSVRRGEGQTALPDGDYRFEVGDEAVLLGIPELVLLAEGIFRGPRAARA